ncbi:hypothetical protein ERJ75_000862900 [Trypanosoma vivax]|uniref:Uncharacterized protein n=1 Tax=Trypanosoma vivax (strain Y486) TaxID=1055687 RepID=F9WVQ8_TRYVY|nr:hypothetical protein ERJ75_000862900 [Trypanosoma vivax]CCD21667.1 hypothetical protein, conserved in T. vivax [Trypanosoma vivax Y486]|eukprot:CCD21667.1 hypothetical protein, conserved in T. vivax [Trypanosoma vivax Y486]
MFEVAVFRTYAFLWLLHACAFCRADILDSSVSGGASASIGSTALKMRENRTLCKAAWFFMEWGATFSAIQRRAKALNKTASQIARFLTNYSEAGKESYKNLLMASLSAENNAVSAISNASLALDINGIFRSSVLQDFDTAYDSIKWKNGSFTFGHQNVMNSSARITEASSTFDGLMKDFVPCKVGYNRDTVSHSEQKGAGSEESDQDEDDGYFYDEDDVKMDEADPNEEGVYDVPLHVPDSASVEASRNLTDLKLNKTALWEKVMGNAQSAVRAMNVSTFVQHTNQPFFYTQNIWRQGTINKTDMFQQDCAFVKETEQNLTRRTEACLSLKATLYAAGEGVVSVNDLFMNGIAGDLPLTNITGYQCSVVGEARTMCLVHGQEDVNCTDKNTWTAMGNACDKLRMGFQCEVKKTAIEWLGLRFRAAVAFMTTRLHLALNDLVKAEERVRSSLINVLNEKRSAFCQLQGHLLNAEKEIALFKKQESNLGERMAEYKIKISNAQETASEASNVAREAMRITHTLFLSGTSGVSSHMSVATPAEGIVELLKCVPMGGERQLYLTDGVGASDAGNIKETPGKYQEILKTFQDKFNAVHGGTSELSADQSCSFNSDKPVPTLSFTPAADIVQVLSALDALQIGSVGDELKALTARYKEKRDQMEERFKHTRKVADEAVECAAKTESVEKATVEKAKNSLSDALKRQRRELCATVEQLQKDKEHAVRLMSRTSRMNESAAEYERRAADAHKEVAQAGARVSGAMSAAARAHEAYESVRDGASALSEKASRLLSEAARATSEADAQAKRIRDALADVIRNVTNACISTADCANVCAGQATYEIKEPLKDALASILSLNALRNVPALPSKLEAMEAEAERIRKLRDDVKRRAMAVVAAARDATDVEGDHTCMPLFVQLLRALH